MAAGGDGTVAWLLKTIKELQLQPPPLLAVMPLGTGNDLSLSFGWGNTFLQAWIEVSLHLKSPLYGKRQQHLIRALAEIIRIGMDWHDRASRHAMQSSNHSTILVVTDLYTASLHAKRCQRKCKS